MVLENIELRQCKNCNNFRQHYIWRNGYMKIEYGHCVCSPRVRHRRPNMKACEKWLPQNEEYLRIYVPVDPEMI